jgi:hypothetical protein
MTRPTQRLTLKSNYLLNPNIKEHFYSGKALSDIVLNAITTNMGWLRIIAYGI